MACKPVLLGVRCVALFAFLGAGSAAWAKPLPSKVLEDMWARTMQKRADVERRMESIQAELEQARHDLAKLPQIAADEKWDEDAFFKAYGDLVQRIAEHEMELAGIDAVRLAIRGHLDWIAAQLIQARQLEKEKPGVDPGSLGPGN